MQKVCENCESKFKAKRASAKYCSPKCRLQAARKAGADPDTGEIITQSTPKGPNPFAKLKQEWQRYADPDDELYEPNPFQRPKDPNYDREANLKAFEKMGLAAVTWISTGIKEFDDLTKIPRGRITQIQGPYGVGKTTLCLNMVSGMDNVKTLYIDTEAALNPGLLADLGLDNKNFTLYNDSSFLEDIAEIIRKAAKSGEYDLIVLDSVPMTSTRTIDEGPISSANIGQKAKILYKLMAWIAMDLKESNTAMVFINQERKGLDIYTPKYTPGGNAIPFQASLIVALKSIKSWRFPKEPKDGVYQGQEVEATIEKSKVNTPWRTKKFKLYYPNPVKSDEPVVVPGEF